MKKLFSTLIFSLFGFVYANTNSFFIGDIELIAIKDADTNMGKAILLNPEDEVVQRVMSDDQNPSSVNIYLLKIKDKLILIDTGFGGAKGDLLNSLKSLNIKPEEIDTILLTHMHGDHISGLIHEGKKVFENAKVLVSEDELKYWLNKETKNSELAKEVNLVYGENLQTFSWNKNISDNIKPLNGIGHTPGHTFFEINSNGEKIIIAGDIVHVLKVQIAKPSMSVLFDVDPAQAAKTRKGYFRKFADEKIKIAGMHIPYPGVGYILKDGEDSYTFESVNK